MLLKDKSTRLRPEQRTYIHAKESKVLHFVVAADLTSKRWDTGSIKS